MMVGSLWNLGFQSEKGEKGFLSGLLLLALLFLAGIVLLLSDVPQRLYPSIVPYRPLGLIVLAYLWVGSSLSFFLFAKKRKRAAFISLMIVSVFFYLHLSYSVPPIVNPQRSVKAFSERILKRMGPGDELKTCFLESNGLIYYTQKVRIESIQSKERFIEVLNSSQRVYVVIYQEFLDWMRKETGAKLDPIDQARVGHWNFVLISNR